MLSREAADTNFTVFSLTLPGLEPMNFGVALYKCDSEYVVKLSVNEEVIINPACNKTTCTYKEFNTFYSDLANCNFDEICENYTNNGVQIILDYIQWFMLVLFYSIS